MNRAYSANPANRCLRGVRWMHSHVEVLQQVRLFVAYPARNFRIILRILLQQMISLSE